MDFRSVSRHKNVCCAPQHHEHRIASGAFLDDRFATPKKLETRLPNHVTKLFFGQTLEKPFASENGQCLGLLFLYWDTWFSLDLQRANGKRNCDAPAIEFIPNVCPNRVVDLVDLGMIA